MTRCYDLCHVPECHRSGCTLYRVQPLPHIIWKIVHLSLGCAPLPAGARLLVLQSTRLDQPSLKGPPCPWRTAWKAGPRPVLVTRLIAPAHDSARCGYGLCSETVWAWSTLVAPIGICAAALLPPPPRHRHPQACSTRWARRTCHRRCSRRCTPSGRLGRCADGQLYSSEAPCTFQDPVIALSPAGSFIRRCTEDAANSGHPDHLLVSDTFLRGTVCTRA